MAIEAFAEAASLLAPGHTTAAVEDVRMLAALKFFRLEPRTLQIAGAVRPSAAGLLARLALRTAVQPAKAGPPGQVKEHFVGAVRLQKSAAQPPRIPPESVLRSEATLPIGSDEVYAAFFHGPAYRVVGAARCAGRCGDCAEGSRICHPSPRRMMRACGWPRT